MLVIGFAIFGVEGGRSTTTIVEAAMRKRFGKYKSDWRARLLVTISLRS